MQEANKNTKKDLWEDWLLFKKNEFTHPAL